VEGTREAAVAITKVVMAVRRVIGSIYSLLRFVTEQGGGYGGGGYGGGGYGGGQQGYSGGYGGGY
jgi:hypothetical protein